MTAATLRSRTAKDLAQMARMNGVSGWHSLRKEELVRALVRLSRKRTLCTDETAASSSLVTASDDKQPDPAIRHKINQLQRKLAMVKNLAPACHNSASNGSSPGQAKQDRLVVMVRDPYWLHACWELSQQTVDRAKVSMGQRWHSAQPVLRVFRQTETGASTHDRDIVIHGGVSNWYVDVQEPPCQFRMEIGYLAKDRTFYCLARSNTVTTPPAGTSDAVDDNWANVAEHADRIFAMSGGYSQRGTSRELQELLEERLQRPLGSPMSTRFGSGALGSQKADALSFAVDAEIIIYGATDRDAHVTLQGEPVQLRSDGTFAVRITLPNKRQVIPIVASSSDGVVQRTTILAVERNTKVMEPLVRDMAK